MAVVEVGFPVNNALTSNFFFSATGGAAADDEADAGTVDDDVLEAGVAAEPFPTAFLPPISLVPESSDEAWTEPKVFMLSPDK